MKKDADTTFVEAMIPHHEEAIRMAKEVLASGSDPEIENLADDIISSQTAEIKYMQRWLKERGA